MKTSVFVATSIDGFIARENGGIDWLSAAGEAGDYGYRKFINSVDAIIMGRNTFQQALTFGSWPYGKKPVFVLSTHEVDIPEHIAKTVSVMSGHPREIYKSLDERGFKHLYIDGGKTIQGFMKEGLIQQLIITMVPILIGSGIPLFGSLPHDVKLHSVGTRQFEDGLIQVKYTVVGKGE